MTLNRPYRLHPQHRQPSHRRPSPLQLVAALQQPAALQQQQQQQQQRQRPLVAPWPGPTMPVARVVVVLPW